MYVCTVHTRTCIRVNVLAYENCTRETRLFVFAANADYAGGRFSIVAGLLGHGRTERRDALAAARRCDQASRASCRTVEPARFRHRHYSRADRPEPERNRRCGDAAEVCAVPGLVVLARLRSAAQAPLRPTDDLRTTRCHHAASGHSSCTTGSVSQGVHHRDSESHRGVHLLSYYLTSIVQSTLCSPMIFSFEYTTHDASAQVCVADRSQPNDSGFLIEFSLRTHWQEVVQAIAAQLAVDSSCLQFFRFRAENNAAAPVPSISFSSQTFMSLLLQNITTVFNLFYYKFVLVFSHSNSRATYTPQRNRLCFNTEFSHWISLDFTDLQSKIFFKMRGRV